MSTEAFGSRPEPGKGRSAGECGFTERASIMTLLVTLHTR